MSGNETPVPLPPHIAAAIQARQSAVSASASPSPGASAVATGAPADQSPSPATESIDIGDTFVTEAPEQTDNRPASATTLAAAITVAVAKPTTNDIQMKDADQVPVRGGGATCNTPGGGSRAASQHPEPIVQQVPPIPVQASEHGDEVRRYINSKVIPHVTDAVKVLVKEQHRPQEPVRWLAEFFAERADQLQAQNST